MTDPLPFPIPERLNLADHLLEARIREGHGGRRALVTDAGTLTYDDVRALANRYGNLLAEEGVQPEQRVLIALPDSADFVAALFGTLKLGAVVVMVNPELSAEQLRPILAYSRARAVVLDASAAAAFGEAFNGGRRAPRMLMRGTAAFEARLRAASPELATFPTHRDDAAIWLFSGGTTGSPKAVVQSHRSFANTTELYGRRVLGLGPDDLTLSVPKLYFGYATGANLFFPFSVGGAAVLFPERPTPDVLFAHIARHRPTVLINVPTMVGQMVAHPAAGTQDLSSLRLATSAGEALPAELYQRWRATFGVELLDGLGTAEMWHVFLSNRPGDVRPGTLGTAVPGFEIRLCDEDGREVPDGEVGELWVRGDSRAWGYWQNLDATRRAFRGEWYVSGDMLRKDEDGSFVYCGRGDDMLKVSGKWMSPAELENCLLQHPGVVEVAVVGVADADGLVKPQAFVVAREPAPGLGEELQAFAKARLEPHKYPRAVTFLPELPRTHLGKVDRGRLARASATAAPRPEPGSPGSAG